MTNKTTKFKILVINGPNINLLGQRNTDVYGTETYGDLVNDISNFCSEFSSKVDCDVKCEFFQSNHEGEIVDVLQNAGGWHKFDLEGMQKFNSDSQEFDAIVLNAAAYTHYSIAIRDAIEAIPVPVAEVHISDVENREDFRKKSVIRDVCKFCVTGLGFDSYTKAISKFIKDAKINEW